MHLFTTLRFMRAAVHTVCVARWQQLSRLPVCRRKCQVSSACAESVPPKIPPKMRFLEQITPSGKISIFCYKKIHVLCSNFTESRSVWNDALFRWQSSCKNCSFYGACLAQGAKSLQGSMPRDPTIPCKILSQSVLIFLSYSRKSDIVQIQWVTLLFG